MAAYGALVSLVNTINIIQHHPHPPISLDKHQIESLTEAANFFKDFLCIYNPHTSYTEEADPLENRIATAAYAAEDAIEFSIVDHIHAKRNGSAARNQDVAAGSGDVYEDLQRVMGNMESIKKEAMEIKQRKHHQILQLQSHSTTVSSASRASVVVGIEQVSYELLDKLIGGNPSRQVIPITGMGGIGKTTLATNAYQNQTVVQHFDIRAWATISQDCTMKEILLKLYQEEDSHKMNEYELGEKLHKKLFGRRYLIVLDDIWDVKVWDALQLYFPDYNNNSRIVLTTRLSKMAHDVSGYGSPSLGIEMKFLDEDTSWDLFCKVVFGRKDCPLELKTLGTKIVESCKGLPLSISVIGGLLAKSAQTRQYWEYVVENLNSIVNSEDNEHCLKILYTSYNSLPLYLKPCFMYIGVFKEDSEIRVSNLIRLWVAEGFVEAESGKSLEEVAAEHLTELVDRNLIIVQQLGSLGKLKLFKIHDLLRDLCLREARKHKFIHILGAPSFDLNGERRICNNEEWKSLSGALGSSSVARSLMWDNKEFHAPLFGLRLLRVCSVHHHGRHNLDFVCRSANLRFICAHARWASHVDSVLSSLSIFWNLQTLIVHPLSWKTPPYEIWNMSQLRHVKLWPPHELPDPPPADDVFVLENLQTLSVVKNMKLGGDVVKRIPNIKKLKVVYSGAGEGIGLHLHLSHLCALSSLSVTFARDIDFFSLSLSEMPNLTFPQSLKELRLRGTKLEWKDMTQKLGSLPLLQVLRLSDDACIGDKWHTAEGQFCSLKILEIEECDLEYWKIESSHFPQLEHLLLTGLGNLMEVPSSIGDITTLQSISLHACSYFAYASAKRIREEQVEQGNEDLHVQIPYDF